MKRGISTLLREFDQVVRRVSRAGVVRGLGDDRLKGLQQLSGNSLTPEIVWANAEAFLTETSTTVLPIPKTALEDMFDLYFDGQPPFGTGHKKAEFPDAANFLALASHARSTRRPIYVVSCDEDWSQTCEKHREIVHVKRLSEMLDKAIRSEWRSDDLRSDEELLKLLIAKEDKLKSELERALAYASKVNLGDGVIHDLTLDDLFVRGLAITDVHQREEEIIFSGELFHSVWYAAIVYIEDDGFDNTLENCLTGEAELTACITIVLPLDDPTSVEISDVHYLDGLNLQIPLKY
jgi:hypothetical protein